MRQDVCAHSHIFGGLLPQVNEQIGVWRGMGHVMIDLSQKPALIRVHLPTQDGNLSLIHWVLECHDVLCSTDGCAFPWIGKTDSD